MRQYINKRQTRKTLPKASFYKHKYWTNHFIRCAYYQITIFFLFKLQYLACFIKRPSKRLVHKVAHGYRYDNLRSYLDWSLSLSEEISAHNHMLLAIAFLGNKTLDCHGMAWILWLISIGRNKYWSCLIHALKYAHADLDLLLIRD